MSAFLIVTVKIKDLEKFKEYGEQATKTLLDHDAEFLIKGKFMGDFAGKSDHQNAGIVKFPSMTKLDEWYNSDAYQTLIPLREKAADVTIAKYAEPPV